MIGSTGALTQAGMDQNNNHVPDLFMIARKTFFRIADTNNLFSQLKKLNIIFPNLKNTFIN